MCGQENCVPFGCQVGAAIEQLGAINILFAIASIFSLGLFIGYFVANRRLRARYAEMPSGKQHGSGNPS